MQDLAHNFGESNLGPEYALSPVEMSVCLPSRMVRVTYSLTCRRLERGLGYSLSVLGGQSFGLEGTNQTEVAVASAVLDPVPNTVASHGEQRNIEERC